MRACFYLLIACVFLTGCGDSRSEYITSINNNTDYEIILQFPGDSTKVCQPNQETVIEEYEASSLKKMSCMTPYILRDNNVTIIVDEGNKTLVKDITDDNNWDCNGDEGWSLIMVGKFYSEIRTVFTVNDEDIKDAE